MQIKVYVPQEEAVKLGLNRYGVLAIEVDMATLTQPQREQLAEEIRFRSTRDDKALVRLTLATFDQAGLIAALQGLIDEAAAAKAKAMAAHEAEVGNLLAMPMEEFVAHTYFNVGQDEPRLADKFRQRAEIQARQWLAEHAAAIRGYLTAHNTNPAGDFWQNPSEAAKGLPEYAEYVQLHDAYVDAQPQFTAEQEARDRAAEAEKQAKVDAVEAARLAWIEAHGSDHLKRAIHAGFNCQRLYVEERVSLELGDSWVIDWDDNAKWRERCCPSSQALDLLEQVKAKGFPARILWVTRDPEDYPQDSESTPYEAVVIEDYLDKYDLVKATGNEVE